MTTKEYNHADLYRLAKQCCQDIEQRTDDLDTRMHGIILGTLSTLVQPEYECVFINSHDGTGECYQCGELESAHYKSGL